MIDSEFGLKKSGGKQSIRRKAEVALSKMAEANWLKTITKAVATSAAIAAFAGPAVADTWIARCNNVQFNFQRDSDRFLVYFKTDTGIFQVARGDIIFDNGVAVRGPVKGNDGYVGVGGASYDGEPITQIGLNPSRQIVYVFYQHPYEDRQKTGIFCETDIDKSGGVTELDTASDQK